MLKIAGGKFRGRKLYLPDTDIVRATSNKVREAVFNILKSRVVLDGVRVLDLFAGSGAIGIEAASWGAGFVEFVENDPAVLRVLEKNISEFELGSVSRVTRGSKPHEEGFDIVFADPPYQDFEYDWPSLFPVVCPGGFFIFESDKKEGLGEFVSGSELELVKNYKYGKTFIHLYEKQGTD
ncbi:MAG: RsmD family RNA methyltransferase [Candidatus Lindowbacteria bacterium]|nr:RsmD family RNA methyltransferase [Candidatus Lindowbacteria bacterium]